jgi:hypothetical protein
MTKLSGIVKFIKRYRNYLIFYVSSSNQIDRYFDVLEKDIVKHIPILYNNDLKRFFKVRDTYFIPKDITLIRGHLYYIRMKPHKIYNMLNNRQTIYLKVSDIENVVLDI